MSVAAANPVYESQATFRAAMEATARPGEIKTLRGVTAPAPLAPATAALVQSLADYETPVWLDSQFDAPAVKDWIRFHTSAPVVDDKRAATFAGPGIKGRRAFAAEPLPDDFAARLSANRELFPRGVDLVLVAGDEILALPRSVQILQGM
jgi:alpha-D-ribose 1-methylphosphonate 5-triphosphate synthase subunit PhnH